MIWRFVNRLMLAFNVVLFLGCAYFVSSRGVGTVAKGEPWQPVELVTVILAALGVLITVLGAFVAVLAIWGYGRLVDEARGAATVAATIAAKAAAAEQVGKLAPTLVADEIERRIGGGPDYAAAAISGEGSDANR